ncbi:UNVERIFIED_CONTAM: Pentatricopeptide repeat-containing protein [Sesamum radiatum]|uniref:Pentatricopeptide repeat-containing protein n=1 Tax=Sesamum radiatum TaxID=300843 RepID=A0AAW2R2G5_SESRA
MIERADEHRTDISSLTQRCKTLNQLKQIHANLLKLPFRNFAALTSLLSFAAASTDPAFFCYAEAIFRNLRRRTTFLCNTMIRGYVQSNKPIEAILCYKDMLNDRLIRNNYTFTPLVKACSMILPDFRLMGLLVHGHVVKLGFYLDPFIASALIEFYALNLDMGTAEELFGEIPVRDVVLWTTMVDGYGKMGDVEKARALFDEMPERNVISWSTIMAAYSRKSDFREMLCLYRTMEDLGLKPNEAVLVSALTACAHLGALAQGLWIHSYAEKCKYSSNPILATALVDMYSKCGCMNLALTVFDQIHDKDSQAWNTIISGLALNGYAMKSLELFDNMVLSGTQPTEATFVAVLTACTHAKLLDKGLSLFENMGKIYKIEAKIEHYACVVDLLARSGKLEEAEKFIDEKMGGIDEGDANVWGALLGACRVHGKVETGNRLWRKLAEKGVDDYGIHVLAYNMFREAGWDAEARNVRRLIQKKQMKKKPGCSAIEVNGIVEEFVAGDVLRPQADDICRILYSLLCDVSRSITLHEYDEISNT